MNAAAITDKEPGQPDRLTFTLFLAAALHAIVILGVSFVPILEQMRTPPSLEVILVQAAADAEKPEEADFLSNASQDGGGEVDENTSPATPFVSELDLNTDGLAPTPMEATTPDLAAPAPEQVLTTEDSSQLVNSDTPEQETVTIEARPDEVLVEENIDIAALSKEIAQRQEEYAKRPKKTFVDARTQESAAAGYMFRWAERIERVGNLNYPEQARQRNLSGNVLLVVGIFKNGDIESISVKRTSGSAVLDDAATNIVRLAAPFDPLGSELSEETDILYIVRTWEFGSSKLASY